MNQNYSRRQFLQTLALGLTASSLSTQLLAGASHSSVNINRTINTAFKPDVEFELTALPNAISILRGEKTHVYQYTAQLIKGPERSLQFLKAGYLAPLIHLQQGQKVRVIFRNQLPEASIVHWHGLHVPQHSDGHPQYAINSGEQYVYEFEVLNPAGSSFYHPHTHELTGKQVYYGLGGLIIVEDELEKKLMLPKGEFDLPFVIQDRRFNSQNQLIYAHQMPQRMMGFLGDHILINGEINKSFQVKSRAYRFRALNASNSRIYKLAWDDGTPLIAIGTDGHLLASPQQLPYIMLSPGERVDLWLDFTGRSLNSVATLVSLPFSGVMPTMAGMHGRGRRQMGGMGMMNSTLPQGAKFTLAQFNITEVIHDSPHLPKQLAPFKLWTDADVDNANTPIEIGLSMSPMSPRLNGHTFAMDRVFDTEVVALGSRKKIKLFHQTGLGMMSQMLTMAHPVHLHGQQYQVLSRKNVSMNPEQYAMVKDGFIQQAWKDTVLVMPGEEIEIIKPFEDYRGLFLYHCHNLEHEDLGMMRQFYVS
ncbi:MAG: hypothetical protein RL637_379 [Pseudomonadota bacterium]|jgi:FtsP/CotA-like multicopper oxidase with cupredoxin domain